MTCLYIYIKVICESYNFNNKLIFDLYLQFSYISKLYKLILVPNLTKSFFDTKLELIRNKE